MLNFNVAFVKAVSAVNVNLYAFNTRDALLSSLATATPLAAGIEKLMSPIVASIATSLL